METTIKKQYFCDRCRKMFETEEECLQCEQHHMDPDGAIGIDWDGGREPTQIRASFNKTGKTFVYVRADVAERWSQARYQRALIEATRAQMERTRRPMAQWQANWCQTQTAPENGRRG